MPTEADLTRWQALSASATAGYIRPETEQAAINQEFPKLLACIHKQAAMLLKADEAVAETVLLADRKITAIEEERDTWRADSERWSGAVERTDADKRYLLARVRELEASLREIVDEAGPCDTAWPKVSFARHEIRTRLPCWCERARAALNPAEVQS